MQVIGSRESGAHDSSPYRLEEFITPCCVTLSFLRKDCMADQLVALHILYRFRLHDDLMCETIIPTLCNQGS